MGNLKAIKSFGDLETPQVILCRKDYERIGELYPVAEFHSDFPLKDVKEISFKIYKEIDGELNLYWDKIQNLRTVYIPDYDEYYEIEVNETESNETFKTVTGQGICECELSNLLLSIDINTESDINQKDYEPTIIYNPDKPSFSLLHRVLKDKAPHYQILHVDNTLAKLQRTFSITDSNINDFLKNELATEIDALVVYDSSVRGISLYDLASVCNDCGHRSVFTGKCPECGSLNILPGYGEYTNVYISTANLSDNVELTAEKSTIKNCFKVCGGDDTINDYIRMVNPNGSDYISCFSELQYEDMPELLVRKLKSYEALCESKRAEYSEIMLNICECIDQYLYYDSVMMPSPETDDTSAAKELAKLTAENLGDIGVSSFTTATQTSVDRTILTYIKIFMSPGYEASITSSRYENNTWYGRFKVVSTSYPKEDFAENTTDVVLNITDDYLTYVKQKIDKALNTKDLADEVYDYTLYGVKPLENFESAYDSCVSILIEHGDSEEESVGYSLYEKYKNLLEDVQKEIGVKEEIRDSWDTKKAEYEVQKEVIQKELDLGTYLGTALYKVYCTYRRDDKYENQNYISDGLTDAEITETAYKLVQVAEKELRLACQNQYTLTSSCYNLFAMPEFEPFHDYCDLGNWIHVEVAGQVYCLRLLKISIDYSSADQITVEFSNVTKVHNGVSDLREILSDVQSIASSYPITAKQVEDDNKITDNVRDWIANGLNATNIMIANSPLQNIVIDENGLLGRAYDDITGAYDPCQLRLINSTIALTDDNWKTTKTAFGKYIYQDPVTGEYKYAYGIIGDVLVGRLILGEELGIYSTNGTSMTFNNNGLMIKNNINTFRVTPNDNDCLFAILKGEDKQLYVDSNGNINLSNGAVISWNNINSPEMSNISGLESYLNGMSSDITNAQESADSAQATADSAKTDAANAESNAKAYAKEYSDELNEKSKEYANSEISKLDEKVAQYLTAGNKTAIGSDFVLSPYIGGGYLNIVDGNKKVVIDPANKTTTGYIFQVHNGTSITVGVDHNGNATFDGDITARSLTLGQGVTIGANYVTGLSTVATTGNYDDLNGTPKIPTSVKELGLDPSTLIYKGDIYQTEKTDGNGITYVETTVPNSNGKTITYSTYDANDYIVFGRTAGKDTEGQNYICISKEGLLTARNAVIYGTIYATDGEFAGTINAGTKIYAPYINGGTIEAANMVSTNFDSCSGGFTAIFMYDKTKNGTDEFQHGSICGQYYDASKKEMKQYEMIRINNGYDHSYMDFYGSSYIKGAEFAVDPTKGLHIGSSHHDSSPNQLYVYFNKLEGAFEDQTNNIRVHSARIGFETLKGTEVPVFEMYDRFAWNKTTDETQHTHQITCKVFGDLTVAGNITYSGEISQNSSIRYKTNVASMSESTALDLLKYNIVTYDYIDGLSGRHGMIAEDASEISEYGIVRDAQGMPDSISYVNFIPDIIKLNQIMYKEIQDLKSEIVELKEKLEVTNE